ncbi:hypothetical protein ACMSFH_24340 [Bacteroides thetaiotaomicron]|uniref:hypothetical protein n=1 Tax=Bacteroides thetaiotaomicron TaxID=818 RepID=UPI0039C06668
MKNLTWQNPEQLFVAQELINKVKSKCCGIKVFINEIKNIVITVVVATSVVQGSLTLSFLCLIRIEQEQPSSNICSFYKRNIDERWILYSPQRLILPIQGNVH